MLTYYDRKSTKVAAKLVNVRITHITNEQGCTCRTHVAVLVKKQKQKQTNLRRFSSPSCAKISREAILNHDFAKRRTTAAGINEY